MSSGFAATNDSIIASRIVGPRLMFFACVNKSAIDAKSSFSKFVRCRGYCHRLQRPLGNNRAKFSSSIQFSRIAVRGCRAHCKWVRQKRSCSSQYCSWKKTDCNRYLNSTGPPVWALSPRTRCMMFSAILSPARPSPNRSLHLAIFS